MSELQEWYGHHIYNEEAKNRRIKKRQETTKLKVYFKTQVDEVIKQLQAENKQLNKDIAEWRIIFGRMSKKCKIHEERWEKLRTHIESEKGVIPHRDINEQITVSAILRKMDELENTPQEVVFSKVSLKNCDNCLEDEDTCNGYIKSGKHCKNWTPQGKTKQTV